MPAAGRGRRAARVLTAGRRITCAPMRKRVLLLCIAALLLLMGTALAACGDDDDDGGGGAADTTGAAEVKTLKPGTLVVGVDVPYPPFEQGRPPDYEGFEIDLTNEIAERLGLETEYKDTPFDTIFRDLALDKFDAAIAGSTITAERERVVDFADPWFLSEQSLLVKKGGDIRTIEDLAGKTVGVQKGTTGEDYVEGERRSGRPAQLPRDRRRVQRARRRPGRSRDVRPPRHPGGRPHLGRPRGGAVVRHRRGAGPWHSRRTTTRSARRPTRPSERSGRTAPRRLVSQVVQEGSAQGVPRATHTPS